MNNSDQSLNRAPFWMRRRIYLTERQAGLSGVMAGQKAPEDVEAILVDSSFSRRTVLCVRPRNPFFHFLANIVRFIHAIGIAASIPKNAVVFLQFPQFSAMRPGLLCLRMARRWKRAKIISLFHDIDSGRGRGCLDESGLNPDVHFLLNLSDAVIVHNDRMRNWLADKGFPANRMVSLVVFDYLIPSFEPPSNAVFEKTVVIAGNLSMEKSPYLSRLQEVKGVQWDLYGARYVPGTISGNNVRYLGCYPASEIPNHLSRGFGLVWDGESLDSCSGPTGEYLRINNPHKLSLFLAAGLPVLIWAEAAEAAFVKEHHVGLLVNSLRELPKLLEQFAPANYLTMKRNALALSEKLRSGHFTKKAFDMAIRVVDSERQTCVDRLMEAFPK